MHPTGKWGNVVYSWAEPISHVTSVAGDNEPACRSRRGYTQLVQFLERRSQILNTENPHIPRVTGVEIIGSNTRLPLHQVYSFYQSSKA